MSPMPGDWRIAAAKKRIEELEKHRKALNYEIARMRRRLAELEQASQRQGNLKLHQPKGKS